MSGLRLVQRWRFLGRSEAETDLAFGLQKFSNRKIGAFLLKLKHLHCNKFNAYVKSFENRIYRPI